MTSRTQTRWLVRPMEYIRDRRSPIAYPLFLFRIWFAFCVSLSFLRELRSPGRKKGSYGYSSSKAATRSAGKALAVPCLCFVPCSLLPTMSFVVASAFSGFRTRRRFLQHLQAGSRQDHPHILHRSLLPRLIKSGHDIFSCLCGER